MIVDKRPKRIAIPAAFDDLLSRDGSLHAAVLATVAAFEPWVEDNKLPFFPGYTDHGPDHVRSVMATAAALIPKPSWEVVTEGDAALVILGTLLHDCAMHLSEDGFRFLLGEEPVPVDGFDDVAWLVAWQTFLSEAMRWDGRKLRAVFGDTTPLQPPPLDAMEMRQRDRLLIGEFVRRHHPRMAHEIALRGVPGAEGRVPLTGALDEEWRHLAGLAARSHGMPLRAAVDRLSSHERRQVRGAHVPYAMALLRIADYVQIDEQRAPADLPKIRKLRSPISRGEWDAHAAVKDLTLTHDDPEALLVRAAPESAATYLKLRGLFDSIQEELDQSWAVLGEVFGRIPELSALGLRIRRLRSNIDDVKELARRSSFVPVAARFDTAGAELLKLLIEPLYGDDPAIGIRELLQNAVDAVLERRDLFEKEAHDGPAVTIDLNHGKGGATLDVEDHGVGMSVDTIVNYFLTAGASFRNSEQWKKTYTVDGKSRVLRSGRFGIGALAAFLIGDRLEVSTRHVDDEFGTAFSASIDDEVLELRKVRREPGTSIRVYVRERALRRLPLTYSTSEWDWFCLDDPSVLRRINEKEIKQGEHFPEPGGELPPQWHRITPPDYREVQWMFGWPAKRLVCNGIRVQKTVDRLYGAAGKRLSIRMPTLSVFDPDGNLPLNLQRSALRTLSVPFSQELMDSIAADFAAFCHAYAPIQPHEAFSPPTEFNYRGVSVADVYRRQEIWNWYWSTPQGWTWVDEDVFAAIQPKQIVILFNEKAFGLETIDFSRQCVMPMNPDPGTRDAQAWLRFVMGRPRAGVGPLKSLQIRGSVVVVRDDWFRRQSSGLAEATFGRAKIVHHNSWTIINNRDTSNATLDVERIVADTNVDDDSAIAELLIDGVDRAGVPEHPLTKVWRKLVPNFTIPFDPVERACVCPPELLPLVEAHRQLMRA